jgi:hypothetical protein
MKIFVFILSISILTIVSCSNDESRISNIVNPPFTFSDPNTQTLLNDVGTFHDEMCLYILDTVPSDIDIFWNSNHYHLMFNIVNERLYNYYGMDTSDNFRSNYYSIIFQSSNLNQSFKNEWQSLSSNLPLDSIISQFEINLIEDGLTFLENIDTSLSNSTQRQLISDYADSLLQICSVTPWPVGEHGIPSTGFFKVMKNSALLWGSYPDNKVGKEEDELQLFQIIVGAVCAVVQADCIGALVNWAYETGSELDDTGTLSKKNAGKRIGALKKGAAVASGARILAG